MLSALKSRQPPNIPAQQDVRHPTTTSLSAIIVLFIVSRVGYYLAGVRFDTSSLPWFWQYLDPALLKANLAQSLWYLHGQPPAFNAFLGLVLNLFPGHEAAAFSCCYLLLGLVFAVALFLLLRGFGVSNTLSAVVTAVYVASPACVLYENWLFYAYPLTVLLLLAAFFWHRFVIRGRFLDAFLLFACAALLALTWSLYHLVWLIGLVPTLALFRRRDWRKVVAAAAVPVLVVVLWYGKNLFQVGEFTGSTWSGMNFARMTKFLTVPERQALYDNGVISAVSLMPPFSNPDKYYSIVPKPPLTDIPVLDQEWKPSGEPNFNNALFIAVSRQYGRDAFKILVKHPASYLHCLAVSYSIYFQPTSKHQFLDGNAGRVTALDRLYNIVFSGRFSFHLDRSLRQTQPARYYLQSLLNMGWLPIIAYALVLIWGFVLLVRRPATRDGAVSSQPQASRTHPSSFFFIWFNVAWVTIVANAIEVGENDRFRFVVDPLVVILLATLVSDWLAGRRAAANDK